jgi:hypothetical protein
MAKGRVLHPIEHLIKKRGLKPAEVYRNLGVSKFFFEKAMKNYWLFSINKIILLGGILNISPVVIFNIFYRHSLDVPKQEAIDKETDKILTSLDLSDLDNN